MNPKTVIKGKIHYVGVNDRNKHLFEGMWPLPYGVSYNSYLIDDETVALIDTVDICYFEVYLRKIKSIIGERPIQYLIINHMEPDHSGSIRLIKQHYPDIIIVGNKQTFGMIEGFYGVTGEQYMVKDEDFLALGHHKLRFYMTPMVHWPETMMTFDETEGVLFSGDGFGCFGTLDGGFLDTRMNLDKYWDEMVRYYSNIVGKYGSPVQKALAKLGGLPISTICSTHGPVWTDNIAKVIGIYDRLSRYAAEEGVVIVYGSMYGNTEQMAEAIAAELSVQGIKNIVMHNVSKSNPSYIIADIFKYRGLIIGSPTYSNQIYPEIESLLSKILVREVKGRYLGYFGSFCWAGAAVKRMGEFAEKSKFEIVGDPVEMKQKLNGYDMPKKEFFSFQTSEGTELNGWMIKPANFSASKKYPVLMYQYSGPGSQQVLDKFGVSWETYMASQGYVIVCVDGRGTGGRGAEFAKSTYLNLGVKEAKDQVETALYLGRQPYVDKNRIGIWGWSYGGYMTIMSMSEGTPVFKAGAAVAPVTDWNYYDTVYGERFMRTPKENAEGYKASSAFTRANNLHGNLLLVHGMADDNVHFQNCAEYAEHLVQLGKQFDMQVYTNRNHSIFGGNTRLHLYTKLTNFFNRELKK